MEVLWVWVKISQRSTIYIYFFAFRFREAAAALCTGCEARFSSVAAALDFADCGFLCAGAWDAEPRCRRFITIDAKLPVRMNNSQLGTMTATLYILVNTMARKSKMNSLRTMLQRYWMMLREDPNTCFRLGSMESTMVQSTSILRLPETYAGRRLSA